jgi:hypothetical protein
MKGIREMKGSTFAFLLLLAVCLALSGSSVFGQQSTVRLSEPHRQVRFSALQTPYFGVRRWDQRYLISYAFDGTFDSTPDKAAVVLYDRSGRLAREAIVWFKDASTTGVDDAAVNQSGDLFVSGGTTSPAGAIANYIAQIDQSGHVSRVIRTTPFLPVYICAAEDGTVWSYGFERDDRGRKVQGSLRLRQYSFAKGQIRAMLDISTLNSSGWTLTDGRYPGEISLRCSSQRVGLFNGQSSEWIEYDVTDSRLKVSKVEPLPPTKEMRITGFAFTELGDAFVSLLDRSTKPPQSGLFRLSFAASDIGKWVPVKGTVGPYLNGAQVGQLLGTDGTELIYTRGIGDSTVYWSKYSK